MDAQKIVRFASIYFSISKLPTKQAGVDEIDPSEDVYLDPFSSELWEEENLHDEISLANPDKKAAYQIAMWALSNESDEGTDLEESVQNGIKLWKIRHENYPERFPAVPSEEDVWDSIFALHKSRGAKAFPASPDIEIAASLLRAAGDPGGADGNLVTNWADDGEQEDEDNTDEKPCWKGYEMVGMKQKGGRSVPNCVPKGKKK